MTAKRVSKGSSRTTRSESAMMKKQDSAVNFFQVEADELFHKCPKPHHVSERLKIRDAVLADVNQLNASLNESLQQAVRNREELLQKRREKLIARNRESFKLAMSHKQKAAKLMEERERMLKDRIEQADEMRENYLGRVKECARKMREGGSSRDVTMTPCTPTAATSTTTLTGSADKSPLELGQELRMKLEAASVRREKQLKTKKARFVGITPPSKRYRPESANHQGSLEDQSLLVPDFSKCTSIPRN